ncbi:helix-turn-helix domain-containing protein [Curvivirga sp.]|uniref:helix-turn-helix domain-containing protein n=1 Tax=Curvivirga sp. TaxID=2856848 RepID=UPI003B5C4D89
MNSHQSNDYSADKRDVAHVFRDRMAMLIAQRGFNLSQFSKSIGIDRSALSQFLAPDSTRLPRAETLCAIAISCGVSLDWLMGLIAADGLDGDIVPSTEALHLSGAEAQEKIAEWHREAVGYKIRYVPCTIPDILRIEDVSEFEFRAHSLDFREAQDHEARQLLSGTPRLETDVEVCIPKQTLELFAHGEGIWKGLDASIRRKQLESMIKQLDEFYPTFRMFIYDQQDIYSSPYTLFGPLRAAVYLGNMYLVVNSVDHIKAISQHFDRLIRAAIVPADRIETYIQDLLDSIN